MRKLLGLAVVLAVVVAILAVGDVLVRHRVEQEIAQRIEAREPGSTARVQISSWPFVGRLLTSGTVLALHAQVTGAQVGTLPVDSVALSVRDLKLSRSDLYHSRVVLRSIRVASVTAAVSQQSVDTGTGLPITLGAGTLGVGGIQATAHVSVVGGRLRISVPPLPSISLPLPPQSLLPCTPVAVLTPGELTLSCSTTTIPSALTGAIRGG